MGPSVWLAGEEPFAAFRAEMAERLRERRAARAGFLRQALADLEGLLAEARLLRDGEAEAQLLEARSAAAEELERLSEGAASPPVTEAAEPRAGRDEMPAGGAREAAKPSWDDEELSLADAEEDIPPEVEPVPEEDRFRAADVHPEGAVRSPAPDMPLAVLAPPAPGAAVRRAAVPVVAPPAPATPRRAWEPRERAVIEREVERLATQTREEATDGEAGLLRLKAIACRLRRAYEELEALSVYTGDVRAARGSVQARIRDAYGDCYVTPLDTNICPAAPERWEELARAYEGLAPAVEAFAWFTEHERELKKTEAQDLLEGIGAAQQLLFRLLDGAFNAGDDQQKELYGGLRDCADALSLFLETLHPSTPEDELARRAVRLPKMYRDLRGSIEKRAAQEASLAGLHALLEDPAFGTREADAARLQIAARTCLDAGVPRTKPELRNVLLGWEALLDGGAGLEALCQEVAKEADRRARKGSAEQEEPAPRVLPAEIERLRRELLPHTRGKRCLFVGGHVQEENRRRIEEALELEALEWPETDRFDSNPHEFAAEVRRCDIVALLIRFMRTGMNKHSEFCREQGKSLVRLPRGLNVARVITDFHDQLVPRAAVR